VPLPRVEVNVKAVGRFNKAVLLTFKVTGRVSWVPAEDSRIVPL
jgi:hypothetical protein